MAKAKKTEYAPIPKSKAKTAYGLLADVYKAIEEEPRRFYMEYVCPVYRGKEIVDTELHGKKLPECCTVGCYAGWVQYLKGSNVDSISFGVRILTGIPAEVDIDWWMEYLPAKIRSLFSSTEVFSGLRYGSPRLYEASTVFTEGIH